jgi:TonB family protein
MRYWLFLVAFVGIAATFAADKTPLVAHVIDSSTNRLPAITVAPEYPHKARRDRVEGEVQVCFDVDRDGRTRRIAVRNSTHRAFEKPSIKAVRASSFRPIGREESLQAIKSCRTFIFSLEPIERNDDAATDVDIGVNSRAEPDSD